MAHRTYRLTVQGELGDHLASAFAGMTLTHGEGTTTLTGELVRLRRVRLAIGVALAAVVAPAVAKAVLSDALLGGQFFLVMLVVGLVSLWRPGAKATERAEECVEPRA